MLFYKEAAHCDELQSKVVLATYIADKMVIQFQNENSDIIQMGDGSMNYSDHVR